MMANGYGDVYFIFHCVVLEMLWEHKLSIFHYETSRLDPSIQNLLWKLENIFNLDLSIISEVQEENA